MTLFRRFLTIAALMVWQGGFIFYTAVVVPIGTDVLGSSLKQGFITRRVTSTMNGFGAVALALMALDLGMSRDPATMRRRARIALFVLMSGAAVMLFALHGRLDGLLDDSEKIVVDRHEFRPLHRAYLWVSSAQWVCAVVYLILTLAAWMRQDGRMRTDVQ
jgi:hypothetical protein